MSAFRPSSGIGARAVILSGQKAEGGVGPGVGAIEDVQYLRLGRLLAGQSNVIFLSSKLRKFNKITWTLGASVPSGTGTFKLLLGGVTPWASVSFDYTEGAVKEVEYVPSLQLAAGAYIALAIEGDALYTAPSNLTILLQSEEV